LLEKRYALRAWRTTAASLRKRWNAGFIKAAIEAHVPGSSLVNLLSTSSMETDSSALGNTTVLPEILVYFNLVVIVYLLDQFSKSGDKQLLQNSFKIASESVDYVQKVNRRTLDVLTALVYFYHVRCHELLGSFDANCRRFVFSGLA
jgi:hypothetical protein